MLGHSVLVCLDSSVRYALLSHFSGSAIHLVSKLSCLSKRELTTPCDAERGIFATSPQAAEVSVGTSKLAHMESSSPSPYQPSDQKLSRTHSTDCSCVTSLLRTTDSGLHCCCLHSVSACDKPQYENCQQCCISAYDAM